MQKKKKYTAPAFDEFSNFSDSLVTGAVVVVFAWVLFEKARSYGKIISNGGDCFFNYQTCKCESEDNTYTLLIKGLD